MSFEFLDRVAVARPRPRPVFKAFRSRLVMNGDARRMYFTGTDRVLLAYDRTRNQLALKILPPDVVEHEGWQAFRIEPHPAGDYFKIDWAPFWDREVGLQGGRPIVRHDEALDFPEGDVISLQL